MGQSIIFTDAIVLLKHHPHFFFVEFPEPSGVSTHAIDFASHLFGLEFLDALLVGVFYAVHTAECVGRTRGEEREGFAVRVVGGCPMLGWVIRSEAFDLLDALEDCHLNGVIGIDLAEVELSENPTCVREEEAPDQTIQDDLVPGVLVAQKKLCKSRGINVVS